jgi:hypothetical protein
MEKVVGIIGKALGKEADRSSEQRVEVRPGPTKAGKEAEPKLKKRRFIIPHDTLRQERCHECLSSRRSSQLVGM